MIRRRGFITLLGGAAAWPFMARAQQAGRPIIGYLGATTASGERSRTDAFVQRLSELGWIEGETVEIQYRWGESRAELFPYLAVGLVRLRVDIIVAASTAAALACKEATAVIPIVFPLTGDPLSTGLVASLAHPGGNVTGLTNQASDIAGKRLEILRDVVRAFSRLAVLANSQYPGRLSEIADIRAAAGKLGLDVAVFEIRQVEEIGGVFETVLKQRAEALYVVGDTVLNSNRVRVATLAMNARLPTMFVSQESAEAGGLMSYGANIPHLFKRGAELVDKILRGAKPGDIPVEQPTKFDLVINLKTAKALGLTFPDKLLALADEVIE